MAYPINSSESHHLSLWDVRSYQINTKYEEVATKYTLTGSDIEMQ